MGRHKDPETLALIQWLMKKGESLGFWVKDEFTLKKGEYFVDLVWKINEKQPPLITFEIETKDNERVFRNTLKIFGTSSDYIIKPWYHFMIIHKSKLSKSSKKALSNILNQHNIRLYESIYNDDEKLNSLESELDKLAIEVKTFLERYLRDKTLGESLSDIADAINKKLEQYPLKKPKFKWSIETEDIKDSYEDAIEFRLKQTTKRGEPILLDKMKEAVEKRMPLVIHNPELEVKDDKKGIFNDVEKFEKIIIGFKGALPPISLTTPSKCITINNLIFSVIKNDENIFCISTENRNIPYNFIFCIEKISNRCKFIVDVDTDIASQIQIGNLEHLMATIQKEKQIILINDLNKEIYLKFRL